MSSKKLTAPEQKRYVDQLQTLTHATTADATRILKAVKWNINLAVEAFFQDYAAQANASRGGADQAVKDARDSKLKAIFKEYEDPDRPGSITLQTIGPFFEAIGIEDMDSDIAVYLVSHELKSESLGDLSLKGWLEGWGMLKVDSIKGMSNQLPILRKKFLQDPEYFKNVYKRVFELGKTEGAKVLPRDMAVGLWQILLPPVFASKPSALASNTPSGQPGMGQREFDWFIDFLEEKNVKGISKDVWTLFVEFATKVPSTYDVYDEEEAWPSVLDEFTEYAKARRAKEASMDLS